METLLYLQQNPDLFENLQHLSISLSAYEASQIFWRQG